MLRVKSLTIILVFAVLAVWLGTASNVSAITLTEEQKRLAAKLSDKEKADMARKAGIKLPASSGKADPKSVAPTVMKVRDVGGSNLEFQSKPKVEAAEIETVTGDVEVPIENVASQEEGEVLEVRRAFSNFAKDANPLTVDTNLKQFGYELFAGSPDTFAPATDVPVPAEYMIGPGDELNIHLYGREDEELVLTVDREGEIAFPSLGPLVVAGMDFAEVRAFIAQQVKEKMVGITADISMGKLRSIRIFALGEVERPGSYTVSGLSTISNALFVSGGLKKTGSMRNIQLKRDGQVMAVIDLYDFLLKGDTSEDERLLPGDVVFVPPLGKTVGIAGQVVRPAIYELKREKTVSELIRLSGGLLPTAYKDMALIERIDPAGGRSIVKISLSKRKPATTLKNGDMLKVFSVTDYENNPVHLLGHVKRPGKYAWHKGMQLREILPSSDALLPEAKLDYGVIERESGINRETSIVHFNVLDAIDNKKSITLEPRDKVYVFKRAQLREVPVVQIAGSVQNPGKYEVKNNMRLWDLVMAAGGMKRDALLDDVELYRENPVSKDITVAHYNLTDGPALQHSRQKNPLLTDLDRVVVHSIYEVRDHEFVSIQGEVKKPGKFVRATNMRVSDLIFASGGVSRDVLMGGAELYRTNQKTKDTNLISFDLVRAMKGDKEENHLLKKDDRLVIHSIWEEKSRFNLVIAGEVKKPGKFGFSKGMRVSDLVFAAGGVTRNVLMGSAQLYRIDQKTKEITLVSFDLTKALKGDKAENHLLMEDDRLVIHSIWEEKTRFNVRAFGEVKHPGDFVYADTGMRVADLVFAAGGMTEKAYVAQAEITRYEVVDGEKRESVHFNINLEAALSGDEDANILLQPYDVLTVRQLTNWREAEKVTVRGEVLFPGAYPIEEGERLSSLLQRVGGFTSAAYLNAAVFTRESIRAEQQKAMDKMAEQIEQEIAHKKEVQGSIKDAAIKARESLALESASRVAVQMKKVRATGRLVIRLTDVEQLKGTDFDLKLRDGDALYVPQRPDQVLVLGQVYNNTAMLYQKIMDRDDYIDMAGGLTRMADDDSIYIIRANGQVEAQKIWGSSKIQPGDSIVVPQKLEQFYLIDSMLDWSKVLMNLGIATAAMQTLGIL